MLKTKAKELQSGYKELEEAIKKEEEREHHFTKLYPRRLLT